MPRAENATEDNCKIAKSANKHEIGDKTMRKWKKMIIVLLISLFIIIIVNMFFFRFARVSGVSMLPNFYDGDVLLVNLLDDTLSCGNVVVCKIDKSTYFVKRIIATGGQHVIIDYTDNSVTVDGIILNEPYLLKADDSMLNSDEAEVFEYQVPDGCYFVMGDNRNDSVDSRHDAIGYISSSAIVGKVIFTIPFGQHFVG